MSRRPIPTSATTIGALCVRGDWACTSGDLAALGHIADQLSAYVHEPLHCELTQFANRCRSGANDVVAAWRTLKEQVFAAPLG